MRVSTSNDVKIYNLSAGKSIPQWLNERKRRTLEKKNIDIRRRIQLIQDFEMPSVSTSIAVTTDQQYIYAAGTYKPTLRCYDFADMSPKFERGLDADVIKILPLSEDYSKVVLLEEERHLEFHARYGRYHEMRIPKFGRDIALGREASDLFIVGSGAEIYRLNIEQGQFLSPLKTDAHELNCGEFCADHQLFMCGTGDGTVEAWDPRDGKRAGLLDCDLSQFAEDALVIDGLVTRMLHVIPFSNPSVTSIKFKNALNVGVGTSTGHILLYDIRSTRPRLIKNHNLGLSIKNLEFVNEADLVLSMDSQVLKIWQESDGQPFAAIEPGTRLQQFVRYPNTGLLFFAHDAPKMLQYFVPALGAAPKWCYYLDTLTEELEETEQPAVYDDYKFVTPAQLEEIGLERLIGTDMLRAYMHGYFINMRLYTKARTLTQPFAYESYKAQKLRDKVAEERATRTLVKKSQLPTVNKDLASKLHDDINADSRGKATTKRKNLASTILEDDRFRELFANPDYELDKNSEQFAQIENRLRKRRERVGGERDASEDEEEPIVSRSIEPPRDLYSSSVATSSAQSVKRKPQFKLISLESSRDFQSFAPSDEQQHGASSRAHDTLRERREQLTHINSNDTAEEAPFGGKTYTFNLNDNKQLKKKAKR